MPIASFAFAIIEKCEDEGLVEILDAEAMMVCASTKSLTHPTQRVVRVVNEGRLVQDLVDLLQFRAQPADPHWSSVLDRGVRQVCPKCCGVQRIAFPTTCGFQSHILGCSGA